MFHGVKTAQQCTEPLASHLQQAPCRRGASLLSLRPLPGIWVRLSLLECTILNVLYFKMLRCQVL